MWIEITRELAQQRATTIEQNIVAKIGTSENINALDQCITSACAEIRTAIVQGGGRVGSTAENYLPASLVNCALSIIIYHFASRGLTDKLLVQGSRYREYSRAMDLLDDIRKGKVKVEDPDGELSSNAGASIVKAKPRKKTGGLDWI